MEPPLASLVALVLAAGAPALHGQQTVRVPAADRTLSAPGAPLFTVGREDGPEHEVFGRVAGMAFDAQNNLYVLDGANRRVQVFDARGRHLRIIGRAGTGPGELIAPLQVVVASDGRVVISDLGRRGFSVFGTDGRYETAVPFAVGNGLTGDRVHPYPRGGVVTTAQTLAGVGGPAADPRGMQALVWQPLGGGRPDTLFRAASSTAQVGGQGQPSRPGGRVVAAGSVVFAPRLHFAVFPDGALATVYGTRYLIGVTGSGPGSSTQTQFTRAIEPRAVTEGDREAARARRRSGGVVVAGSRGGAGPQPVGRTDNMQFASVMPVIQGLAADRDGRLWVQRAPGPGGQTGPIDILTQRGQYLGTLSGIELPAAFGAGRAAWIEKDELGVQRVVVRSLPASWR